MNKFVALLRAVNVGGHNRIKMDELKKLFVSLGYKNVKTVIQSGNVIFETTEKNKKTVTAKIEKKLYALMEKEIKVFIRSYNELEKIVKSNPFENVAADNNVKTYVFFLYEEPLKKIKIPFASISGEVNVIKKTGLQLFVTVKKIPGKASSPNDFIEKRFKISATARNWNVVCKIVEKALV